MITRPRAEHEFDSGATDHHRRTDTPSIDVLVLQYLRKSGPSTKDRLTLRILLGPVIGIFRCLPLAEFSIMATTRMAYFSLLSLVWASILYFVSMYPDWPEGYEGR